MKSQHQAQPEQPVEGAELTLQAGNENLLLVLPTDPPEGSQPLTRNEDNEAEASPTLRV